MHRLQYAPCDGLTLIVFVTVRVKLPLRDREEVSLGDDVSDDVTLPVTVRVGVVDGVLVVVEAIPVSV